MAYFKVSLVFAGEIKEQVLNKGQITILQRCHFSKTRPVSNFQHRCSP